MTSVAPAVADTNWLEPPELYLMTAGDVERDRPIYQGDVFADVPNLVTPAEPPSATRTEVAVERGPVMVVPHPCQCYSGDTLRPCLTVAPIKVVAGYYDFRPDRSGAKDKFALPDLPYRDSNGRWLTATCVADFGRLLSAPSSWLDLEQRVACLSHKGLGLLAKRVLGFQLRFPSTLSATMAYTHNEWYEAFLMQAWIRRHRSLKGYSAWLRTAIDLPTVGAPGELVKPYDVRGSANDVLLQLITGEHVDEPADEFTE